MTTPHIHAALMAEYAKDTLETETPQPAIPDGWQLVPKEPTHEMVKIACEAIDETGVRWADMRVAWSEMLAAAPEPSK